MLFSRFLSSLEVQVKGVAPKTQLKSKTSLAAIMTRTREYIQDKKIEVLFEELMRSVVEKKPEDPVSFIVTLLQVNLYENKSFDSR